MKVAFVNGKLKRIGRPKFPKRVNKNIEVKADENRRHILHGATQISDVLIEIFNEKLAEQRRNHLEKLLNKVQRAQSCKNLRF
jgi:hypothetical protein